MTVRHFPTAAVLAAALLFAVPSGGRSVGAATAPASTVPASTVPASTAPAGDALPRDPANVYGTFPNGLHYLVRRNATPPGKVYLDLAVRTGSLNETAEQNGLAHFLEHMAFKGSDHFDPMKLIPVLTHLGMRFGADTNAHTNQFETVFKLAMPDAKPETLDLALTIFADYANGLKLYPVQIDSERRVILEEVRVRDTLGRRLDRAVDAALYPGTRMAVHDVLGDVNILRTAQRPLFADYWNTWYRPENMTLVVVGDVDPATVIAHADPLLGHWSARAPARPAERAGLSPTAASQGVVVSDPEQAGAAVGLSRMGPARPPMTTVDALRRRLVETIGQSIVDRRLGDRVARGDAPFQAAGVSTGDVLRDGFVAQATAGVLDPADWPAALSAVVAEVRTAATDGFTPAELEWATSSVRSGAEREVKTEPTQDSAGLVGGLSAAVDTDRPILSAAQNLAIVERVLPTITAGEVRSAFAADFAPGDYAYVLKLPAAKPGQPLPSDADVLAAGRAAWARPLSATTLPTTAPALTGGLATDFPPAAVATRSLDDKLGLTTVTFANGVVMHHRFSDHKRDQVAVHLTLPGGILQETPADRGISVAAGLVFARPTTAGLDWRRVRDLLHGKSVSVSGAIGIDAMTVTVGGSPTDLPLGLSLARALLTDGRVDPVALAEWKRGQLQAIRQRPLLAGPQAADAMWQTLLGGDPRFGPLSPDDVNRQQAGPAAAWFHAIADHAAVEVGVVGDLPADAAVDLVGRYFGSLPKRVGTFADLDPLRAVHRGAGPFVRTATYRTAEPKATVTAGFLGLDEHDPDRRPLQLAAGILTERMIRSLRFEQQLVYSIGCSSSPATALPGTGTLAAGSTTDPANADRLADGILDEVRRFAADGPTADEMVTAHKQAANRMAVQMADPGFWLGQTAELVYRHRPLAELEQLPEVYQAITAEQARDAVRRCVADDRLIRIEVLPDAGPATTRPAVGPTTVPAAAGIR